MSEFSVMKRVAVNLLRVYGQPTTFDGCATVNGVEDTDGNLFPMMVGDEIDLYIDLETGIIRDWPEGTTCSFQYKLVDRGTYTLYNDREVDHVIIEINGYVPSMLSIDSPGYGDYINMTVDGNGKIKNWKVDLDWASQS